MRTTKRRNSMIFFLAVFMVLTGFGMDMELKGEVIEVKISVSPSDYTGNCPKLLIFKGGITVNKGKKDGEYRYRWIRSDGAFGPVKGGTIKRNGSIIIKSEWLYGGNGNVYRDLWQQVQILPNSYRIGSRPGVVKPLLVSNKAFFTLNCLDVATPRNEGLLINNTVNRVRLPEWEISGRISPRAADGSGSRLQGRKVKVILRKGSNVTRYVFTLDRNSSCNYKFKSPFISAGTYYITVEKGPSDRENYSNELNICFSGTNPVRRTVTLTSANKKALNQDFEISYSILWGGGQPLCW